MTTLLAEVGPRSYVSVAVGTPGEFTPPVEWGSFACLLWDHGGGSSENDRAALSKLLIDAGCRYAVCGGACAAEWELAVDLEFVRRHLGQDPAVRDAEHVMTTAHAGEPPEDVAFFFVMCTNFDKHDFQQYLVLHIGRDHAVSFVDAAVRRAATER